jgi:hypothetical protein
MLLDASSLSFMDVVNASTYYVHFFKDHIVVLRQLLPF